MKPEAKDDRLHNSTYRGDQEQATKVQLHLNTDCKHQVNLGNGDMDVHICQS